MYPISVFLKKFETGRVKQHALKTAITEAIHEVTGVPCTPAMVSLKGRYAYIKAGGVLKSEIMLRRKEISHLVSRKMGHAPTLS